MFSAVSSIFSLLTVYDLSKEEVESDENGFVKVEIGK